MSVKDFLTKENIDMLWEIIIDENIFKLISKDNQLKVFNIFIENVRGFFEEDKKVSVNLIDMNKKYILLILNYIKKNYSNQLPSKIKIYEEPLEKELITYEEIKNDKKSQFEKDLIKRQEEFTKAMSLVVPEIPEFADNVKESPINEMDKIIKEMTAKRNYDVEQINRLQQNGENADEWLKPQETSVKNEKLIKQPNIEKNVTWGKNEEIYLTEEKPSFENNIFNKLKKVKLNNENITLTINPDKTIEERIMNIEEEFEIYKIKIDKILSLIENRENKK